MKKVCSLLLVLFLIIAINKIQAQGTWSNLGAGIPQYHLGVFALCADTVNNVLYAGGAFDSAGTIKQNSLAKWDGIKWDTTVSINPGTYVNALIMYGGNLIIGFSDGGVGEYNGSTLHYLPGFDAAVYCFYIYNDTLYAGGEFNKSGNTVINSIGKWNGTKWLPVGKGIRWIYGADVVAMTAYNGDLIAGGQFDSAGSVAATSIAAYDGNNWKSLGVNLNVYGKTSYVGALAAYKNKLYVAGNFDSLYSIYTAASIADWDGTNWDTILSNTTNLIIQANPNVAMTTFDGYLFVSGRYDNQVPYKYNIDSVSTVDSGVDNGSYINAMVAWNGSLYVGGNFGIAIATKLIIPCIARWTPDTTTTGIKQTAKDDEQVSAYPNPTSNQLTFNSSQAIEQLQIEDVLGQVLSQQTFNTPIKKQTIPVSTLPAGIYFYKLTTTPAQVLSGKFIKE